MTADIIASPLTNIMNNSVKKFFFLHSSMENWTYVYKLLNPLQLLVTDVSTTCAEAIFRVKPLFIIIIITIITTFCGKTPKYNWSNKQAYLKYLFDRFIIIILKFPDAIIVLQYLHHVEGVGGLRGGSPGEEGQERGGRKA